MTKKSLLNIEAGFGMTSTDIADLRAQVDNGTPFSDEILSKNHRLLSLKRLEDNKPLQELLGEIGKVAEEDFDFILRLSDPDGQSVFGRRLDPGESELLSSSQGADMVVVVALNASGEKGARLAMDMSPYLPDTIGELGTNDFLMFPSWIPYGFTRNYSDQPQYYIEVFFDIVGTKSKEDAIKEAMEEAGRPEPQVDTLSDKVKEVQEKLKDSPSQEESPVREKPAVSETEVVDDGE